MSDEQQPQFQITDEQQYSFHPFDEREFRERFFPAVYGTDGEGEEEIVRELLDAADAAGPSWTALHKLFDETRAAFKPAVETEDGGAAQTTIFAAFPRFLGHLRPAFVVEGFGFTHIDRREFPELTSRIRSGGALLKNADGRRLPGIGPLLPSRVPERSLPGRSGGGVILCEDVRPTLDRFRQDMRRLAQWADRRGLPAEEGLTMMLAALVEAKLKGCALLEGFNALVGDPHLPNDHVLDFAHRSRLPYAVLREAGEVFGRNVPPPAAEGSDATPAVTYTPQGTYEIGQRLVHKAFGQGEVVAILDSRRLRVQFADVEKTLIQGLPPAREAAEPTTPDAEEPAS